MGKYEYVLKKLQKWWEKRGDKGASRFDKGRARATVRKYRHDLTEFADWWQKRDGRPALKVYT